MPDNREIKSIIESILFVWAEPIHYSELAKILELDKKELLSLVNEMKDEANHYRRGIVINIFDNYIQMATRKDHEPYISKLVKNSKKILSNSAMETLAIIAYKQPVTKVEIDNIRGVKSYSSVENLLARGLIEEVGRLDKIGKPILYGTTIEFLRAFNISSLKELPSIENLSELDIFENDEN